MKKFTHALLVIISIFFSANVFAQPPGGNAGRWQVHFADEFNGTSLNQNTWFAVNRVQAAVYGTQQVRVNNGTLKILMSLNNNVPRGASLKSRTKFGPGGVAKYGYYEARLRVTGQTNANKGMVWPSFWLWGNRQNGQLTTEIDMMEYSGYTTKFKRNSPSASHHYRGNVVNGKKSTSSEGSAACANRENRNWHRFGVYWGPNDIIFYYDGVPYLRSARPDFARTDPGDLEIILSGTPHTRGIPSHNNKAPDGFCGNCTGDQPNNVPEYAAKNGVPLPTFEIDWVRVWRDTNTNQGPPGNVPNSFACNGAGVNGAENTGGGNNTGGGSGGTANVPGTLEAESFTAKTGQVQAVTAGGKSAIGYVQNGSSSTYSINVASSGTYAIDVYAASAGSGGNIDFTVNGNVLGTINVPTTNGWNNYQKVSTGNIFINAGIKTLVLKYRGAGPYLFNLDGLVWRAGASGGGNTPPPPPTNTGGNNASGAPIGSAITIKPVKVSWVPNTLKVCSRSWI